MKLNEFRRKMTYLLWVTQALIIITALVLYLGSGFSAGQLEEIYFLILPLFLANTILAARFYTNKIEAEDRKGKRINGPIQVFGFGGLFAFGIFILIILFNFSSLSGDPDSFNLMKRFIGYGQIFFGIYVGFVFSAIFKPELITPVVEKRLKH